MEGREENMKALQLQALQQKDYRIEQVQTERNDWNIKVIDEQKFEEVGVSGDLDGGSAGWKDEKE